jgi:hypothetical protein
MASSIFAFYLRNLLIVRGDAVQTARNITTSEWLFRIDIASQLVTVVGVIVLVWALYTVLRPINRSVALLATFWRLAENFMLAVITSSQLAALLVLSGADRLRAFDPAQLQALARLFIAVHGQAFGLGFVFLGLGSTVFSWLWLRSRYIPRALAAWGIFSSLVMAIVTLAILVFPGLAAGVTLVYMAPMFVYEVTLGCWLVVKGLPR